MDGVVRTFDLRAGRVVREHVDEPVVSVALSPDGRFLLAGCLDGSLRLLDKRDGQERHRYVATWRQSCSFHQVFLTTVLTTTLPVHACAIDRSIHGGSYRGHHMGAYRIESCFSVDGAFALSGSEDGRVYAYEVVSGHVTSFPAHDKPVRALAAHPEIAMVVTGSIDGTARVWTNE